MKGFIRVTGSTSKVSIRINVMAIGYYEPIQMVNGNVEGTSIHLLDNSFRVTELPEEIDQMIEDAQIDAIEYRYGGGELA